MTDEEISQVLKEIDILLDILHASIRDLQNERNKIILRVKEAQNE